MPKATSDSSCSTTARVKLSALVILLSSLLLSAAGQAADSVGSVKFARGDVTIVSSAGETRKAATDDDLMLNELVVTGAASVAVILLNDDSRMVLRPFSEFRVNRFDLGEDGDDDSSNQSAVLNLLRGGLRLVTGLIGKVSPARYRLSTPVATIGIRGTEFSTRLCTADCAAEERQLAGSDAAASINEGLYVKVDEGRIFLQNFAIGEPLDLQQGESGYVSDLNSLPVKLGLIPAFQSLDRLPSPSQLDFDNIQISDDELEANVAPEAGLVAAVPAGAAQIAGLDISGTYELDEITYTSTMPIADRRLFFGANPDLEFILTQEADNISGEFSGDRDGKIFDGKIDGDEVKVEFFLEARGEFKEGTANWTVGDDGSLEGEFNIRDPQKGVIRGFWTLIKIE